MPKTERYQALPVLASELVVVVDLSLLCWLPAVLALDFEVVVEVVVVPPVR